MRKKILIASLISFLFIGIIYFLILSVPSETEDKKADISFPAKTLDQIDNEDEGFSGVDTLINLLGRGDSAECKVWHDTDYGEIEGTMFIDKQDLRADFVTKSPDLTQDIPTSFIVLGNEMYYWSEIEGELYGVKGFVEKVSDSGNSPISANEKVRYQCNYWTNVDRSVFVAPSNIDWFDLDSVTEPVMEYGTIYEEEGEF